MKVRIGLQLAIVCALLLTEIAPARSAEGPRWQVFATAVPTNLPPGGEGKIFVSVANIGDGAVHAGLSPVTITDVLPSGLTATGINTHTFVQGFNEGPGVGATPCSSSPTMPSCTFSGLESPFDVLGPFDGIMELAITVKVEKPVGTVMSLPNEIKVEGGEAPPARLARSIVVNGAQTPFGVEQYEFIPENEDGSIDTQAGSHPFQLTTNLVLNTRIAHGFEGPAALPKDLQVKLPPGLIGNPTAVPQCTNVQFVTTFGERNECPADTAVGAVLVTLSGVSLGGANPKPIRSLFEPLFNLTPARGEPARLGFLADVIPIVLDTAVRTGGDYGVTVSSNNILQTAGLVASHVTVWGVPGDARHDTARGWGCLYPFGGGGTCNSAEQSRPAPFLTLPTSCGPSLETSAAGDSWSAPGKASEEAPPVFYRLHDSDGQRLELRGCRKLPFGPTIDVAPEAEAASSPAGLSVEIHVPQETTLSASGLAEADVRDATVTLPVGMQVNPASADGLEACSIAAVGFEGFDVLTQADLFSSSPAVCPDASKVGTVEITTPLLPNPLEGFAYLAAQNVNPFGSLLALYIVAEDPVSGVRVKLAGKVTPDPRTGQLTSTFERTPQVPFEDLKLKLFGGSRAPISTPPHCGSYTTVASFTPWSGTAAATPSSDFEITSGPAGAACADPLPFSPSLTAGSSNIQAGGFTPFTTTFSRADGNQNLDGIQLHMPPGLLGKLASVQPCPEPSAAEGTCGPESLIGHTVVSVGLGSDPYTVSGGQVFITGPYKGAPYGLSIAAPAKAGPFDLGGGPCDCVVVRAKIDIDPHTSALTVTSDSLPQMLQGIPLQVKHVNVTIDRPGFTFNPTDCAAFAITGTLSSVEGASAPVSVPFQVANCATLPFKPKFTAATKAATSKKGGAYLHVRVTSGAGQANIGKVKVDLPVQLPSRLTTLQKACTAAVFDANPANCPGASVVGTATAVTPVLKGRLNGPAYLVSHGGAAFPDLEIVLQGEGITLILDGNTKIKKGVTSSTFQSVPDAPINTFDLVLPQGPHSALGANGSFCAGPLTMPTVLAGQNGAVIKQATKVTVSGCPKAKGSAAKAHKRGAGANKR